MTISESFIAARKSAVPLIAVETPDAAETIRNLCAAANSAANGSAGKMPLLEWDIVRALQGINDAGKDALDIICGSQPPGIATGNPTECLSLLSKTPDLGIIFIHNAHLWLKESVIQAIWNLRDDFKSRGCTLVLLAPAFIIPPELKGDIVLLREPLPSREEIKKIASKIIKAATKAGADMGSVDMDRILDALSGLPAFAAEQSLAMSISKSGIDYDGLWERKRQQIEQSPGLSVWRGGEKFSDIGGCENVKKFLRSVIVGNNAPRAVVFIDEIEKALAGSQGDTSGVSQSMLGTLLTWMQDREATGCIFIGPPGAAKSAVAKAVGAEGGIPTIAFDLTGMKASLVGESEQRLRAALAVVDAVAQWATLFIATCNSIGALPPELRRRFTFGTFFFDLPTKEDREMIWNLYIKKFKIKSTEIPASEGWTGAEIKQCCNIAYRLNISLAEAAEYIVPLYRSAGDSISKLREQANGRFISASSPGVFRSETKSAERVLTL